MRRAADATGADRLLRPLVAGGEGGGRRSPRRRRAPAVADWDSNPGRAPPVGRRSAADTATGAPCPTRTGSVCRPRPGVAVSTASAVCPSAPDACTDAATGSVLEVVEIVEIVEVPDDRRRVLAVSAPSLEAALDHLERQEVLALLAQHPSQPFDVVLVELAVPRRGALGVDETLALEEADLRDGDVGELLAQQGEDVPDRQVCPTAHRPLTDRSAGAASLVRRRQVDEFELPDLDLVARRAGRPLRSARG